MTILLLISRSMFLIAVVFYLYFFSQRKKKNVIVQMWLSIIAGMSAGLLGQLISVYLGDVAWTTIQLSFYLYAALIIYSVWKLSTVLKKHHK